MGVVLQVMKLKTELHCYRKHHKHVMRNLNRIKHLEVRFLRLCTWGIHHHFVYFFLFQPSTRQQLWSVYWKFSLLFVLVEEVAFVFVCSVWVSCSFHFFSYQLDVPDCNAAWEFKKSCKQSKTNMKSKELIWEWSTGRNFLGN